MKKIVCIILVLTICITVIYGGFKGFSIERYMIGLQAVQGKVVDVGKSLSKIWTHDYFNINTGIQWVDSIIGDGLVEGIVNSTYRIIDSFKVLGTAVKDWLVLNTFLNPINPVYFVSYENEIYKWTDDDYTFDEVGTEQDIVVDPTTPSGHRGGN